MTLLQTKLIEIIDDKWHLNRSIAKLNSLKILRIE
jgi:hypothetical protein